MLITINGFLYASMYWQFDPTDVKVVIGIVFAALLFMATGQLPQLSVLMAGREIFYKQRGANFFQTSAYVMASLLAQLPLALAESTLFGSLVYWTCGFEANAGNYFQYLVIMLLTNMTFSAWFFFIAAVSPSINVGNPISMVSILVFMIFSGFFVTKDSIPDYFIWLYWMSPLTWSIRAVTIIQYRSDAFSVCEYEGINYCETTGMNMGEYYLSLFGIQTDKFWVWLGMIVLAGLFLLFILLSSLFIEYQRYETPENVTLTKKTRMSHVSARSDRNNEVSVPSIS